MRKTIFVIVLAVVSSSAMAKWEMYAQREYTQTVNGGGLVGWQTEREVIQTKTSYVNLPATYKKNKIIKVSTLTDSRLPEGGGDYPQSFSVKSTEEVDCKVMKYRSAGVTTWHSGHMGKGMIVEKGEINKEAEWSEIENRELQILYKRLCEKAK